MTPDLATEMARLARDLHGGRVATPTVDAVLELAVEIIPGADWVSITVRRRRRHTTLASTHPRASRADELQYETGEGPCVEVADNEDWMRSGAVGTDRRWPTWGPIAEKEGVGSLLSVSLTARDRRIGALNMYSGRTGAFGTRDEIDFALLFAVHAALAMSSAQLVTGLESALGSRHVIGVAQGIVMERHGLTLDQSFALISRISSHDNIKVADLCSKIVETGRVPGLDGGPAASDA